MPARRPQTSQPSRAGAVGATERPVHCWIKRELIWRHRQAEQGREEGEPSSPRGTAREPRPKQFRVFDCVKDRDHSCAPSSERPAEGLAGLLAASAVFWLRYSCRLGAKSSQKRQATNAQSSPWLFLRRAHYISKAGAHCWAPAMPWVLFARVTGRFIFLTCCMTCSRL